MPLAWSPVNLTAGLKGEARLVVGEADTARALGSGDVDVLGTPRLVALFERATCDAIQGRLEPGTTTVSMRVQVDHLQPTPIGAEVVAEAYLEHLYTAEGQEIAAKHHFRPRLASVQAKYAQQFPALQLATIEELGGWQQAQSTHFADGGIFDQIYQPGR